MTPLRQAIEAAAARLAAAGVASPRIDAELLAAHVAGVERSRLMFLGDPGEGFGPAYDELVAARSRRVPLQHLIGTAPFGPLTLEVGPGVFIPRPETEALLEWACAQQLPSNPLIIDLCTGSGALALALAAHRPDARVLAVENSPAALEFARRNAVGTCVEVLDADVTTPGLLPELDAQVDLLVSNPPYIPDTADLEPEVAEHDPAQALFGGPDGMAVIRPIVTLAARWLRAGALCAVEHDDTTSERTVAAFASDGHFDEITARRDLAGRPRFVTATRVGRS
ncbi:protein-(glutamine-N5) methyltransferase, release factor-specific [Mycolicibacterium conceptionense]|uniref:Release factor glutamine methyltransferase n=1 Tax=Mycolicibacterium conceptionense TaxID=451644 RepID=A0A0U1DP99_9MYCO|nr:MULTISPECIES: peptide chain release factor N(5)-glutamine methyltransferase [Mycolicibacterium]MCW1822685.1 peptide chain release factor N(5)-glutamine methyltransferase [Mycolicibacterium senegalense]OBB05687.1 protein-(glutamine-N5) methyltransferase, release factor-specific [Mycolicibacterium conceptionense]OBF05828.1 protein-(glutamine-N5) methyltransferase, release factor-specific [Mycolicibacterium conceptionense]OBF18492.1 protein-(glutamine-N5) methyltransferase, release factor-speci